MRETSLVFSPFSAVRAEDFLPLLNAQARFPHPDGPSGEGSIRWAGIQQVKEDRPMAKLPRPPHHLVENRHAASPAGPGEHDGKLHPLVIGLDAAPPRQGAVEEEDASQ